MGQPDSGPHTPNQPFEFRKAGIRSVSDAGEERDMVRQKCDADSNEQDALQNGKKEPDNSQNNEDPPENQPQHGFHVRISQDLL